MSRALVLHPQDNVATLLDAGHAGEACALQGEASGCVTLLDNVSFGHKVCIADTPLGAQVVKYGLVIGRATRAIRAGEHAHVHNVDSARGRGDLAG